MTTAPIQSSNQNSDIQQFVEMPIDGKIEAILISNFQETQFGFALSEVKNIFRDGKNLILELEDGQISIEDIVEAMNNEEQPTLTFTDASGLVGNVFPSEGNIDAIDILSAQLLNPNVENIDELAEELLEEIEPEAGDAAGGARNGFGFESEFQPNNLDPVGAIGPLGETELPFDFPEALDETVFIEEFDELTILSPEIDVEPQFVVEDNQITINYFVGPEIPTSTVTITISGIPNTWTVSGEGTYDPATETWSLTVVNPGGPITVGPTLQPPANSDVDLTGLTLTVFESSPATEQFGTTSSTFDVIVDAEADIVDVTADDESTGEGQPLDLDIMGSLPVDTDGSESIVSYTIQAVDPNVDLSDFTFSFGAYNPSTGILTIDNPADVANIGNLVITPNNPEFFGDFDLQVTVNSAENPSDGEFDTTNNTNSDTTTFNVEWTPDANPPEVDVDTGVNVDQAIVDEDGTVIVGVTGTLDPNGSGNEILSLTVTGIDLTLLDDFSPSGQSGAVWVRDPNTPDNNASFTITLPAGENYTGTFSFSPAADSDVDITNISVTATAREPATNTTASSGPDTFDVIVDAVADTPNLNAQNASGEENTSIPLIINTSVTDTDGSETIGEILISNLPTGATLNAGTENNGVWTLAPAELNGLEINIPNGTVGTFTLNIESVAVESNTSDVEPDLSDNEASAFTTLTLNIDADNIPQVTNPDTLIVDETDLNPTDVVNGSIAVDFGDDAAGSTITGNNTFNTNGATSGGQAINVSYNAATGVYTGTAGNETIFTLEIQNDGDYTFTLIGTIDHTVDGDNSNGEHDDGFDLTFGFVATDGDGDEQTGTIAITVKDDGPSITDAAQRSVDEDNLDNGTLVANGSFNFDFGQDGAGAITPSGTAEPRGGISLSSGGQAVTINTTANGYEGVTTGGQTAFTLTVNNNGTYTYTQILPLDHVNDQDIIIDFDVRITDFDGDFATATASVVIDDSTPTIIPPETPPGGGNPDTGTGFEALDESDLGPLNVSGQLDVDFGGDGPGEIVTSGANGNNGFEATGSVQNDTLTSAGVPVTVTRTDNGYTGTANGQPVFELVVNPDGSYDFTLTGPLDHDLPSNDPTGNDDTLTLNFGVQISDSDGSTSQGTIQIEISDDGVMAVNDTNGLDVDNTDRVDGNVINNDDLSVDGVNRVSEIQFGNNPAQTISPNGSVTINGQFGQLTINSDGSYDYVLFDDAQQIDGSDTFTYTLVDSDGDFDTATLTINSTGDEQPVITGNLRLDVDESHLNPIDADNGVVVADFGSDTPGTILPEGLNSISFTGSDNPNRLTSNGQTVDIILQGNSYIGRAGGEEIFRLSINTQGQAVFTLSGPLDHANPNNPNDVITINFGVVAQDSDGDRTTGDVIVRISDDGPIANDDTQTGEGTLTGNVSDNDDAGADVIGEITQIRFGSEPAQNINGSTTVEGQFGELTINSDGTYTYVSTADFEDALRTDTFTYTLTDADGDRDTATLTINIQPNRFIVEDNDDNTINGGPGADILVGDTGGNSIFEQEQDLNVVLILDNSGSMAGSEQDLLQAAVNNLLNDYNGYQTGEIQVHIVTFSTRTNNVGTFTVTDDQGFADAQAFINNMPNADGTTNYEAALQSAVSWLQGSQPIDGAKNFTYFISDGAPNRALDNNGNLISVSGSQSRAEIVNEVADLQSLNEEVFGIGIGIDGDNIINLNDIDSDGSAQEINSADELTSTFNNLDPIISLSNAGDDTINGGGGDDIIFGDVLNTDALADQQGLNALNGAGFSVFERLENGEGNDTGWDRQDTIQYIKDNALTLSFETVSGNGTPRQGGNDTLNGGAGDDLIFGQEGDDIISGGAGDDTLYGGSGSDTFIFDAIENGVDTIGDFEAGSDILDISGLLQQAGALQNAINDFVFKTEVGGNTILSFDQTGSGNINNAQDFAVLNGVTGLNLDDILQTDSNGNV